MTDDIQQFYDRLDIEAQYLFDERAAIMEYDGGLSREDAEMEAAWIMLELQLD